MAQHNLGEKETESLTESEDEEPRKSYSGGRKPKLRSIKELERETLDKRLRREVRDLPSGILGPIALAIKSDNDARAAKLARAARATRLAT